jgi:hypothetical protein
MTIQNIDKTTEREAFKMEVIHSPITPGKAGIGTIILKIKKIPKNMRIHETKTIIYSGRNLYPKSNTPR